MSTPVLTVRDQARRRSTAVDAALIYVGLRVVSALVIVFAQRDQPAVAGMSSAPYTGMLTHWDALWFHTIATSGYPQHLPYDPTGAIAMNAWAFYPGFPFLTRVVMEGTDTGFAMSATLLNLVCGVVAAVAIARLLDSRIPRSATLAVVAVWAALPMAPSLQLAYSEALGMALLSVSLLCLQRERWGRAAVAALLLGLTRPMLPPLAAVFGVAVWLRWRRRAEDPVLPAERRRMAAGLLATVAGSTLWPLIAWRVTGVRDAYTGTESVWHHHDMAPFSGFGGLHLIHDGQINWARLSVAVAICIVAALTVAAVRSPRIDPLLSTWCVAYLVFDLAAGNMHADEFRLLLPLFPLVAVACGVASTRLAATWRQRAWLGVTLGIVGQYAWVMLYVRFLPGISRAP